MKKEGDLKKALRDLEDAMGIPKETKSIEPVSEEESITIRKERFNPDNKWIPVPRTLSERYFGTKEPRKRDLDD